MWADLTHTDPWPVEPGKTYVFEIAVPGSWTVSDVQSFLANGWNVSSIHPNAHVTGGVRDWDVLAVWTGPSGTLKNAEPVSYAGRLRWDGTAPPPVPTPVPTPAAPIFVPPPPATEVWGFALLGAAIGFALGLLPNFRARA